MYSYEEFKNCVLSNGDIVKEGKAISVCVSGEKITCNIENSLIDTIGAMFDIYEKRLSDSPIGWDHELRQYFFRCREKDELRNDWNVVTNGLHCEIEDFPELAECMFRKYNGASENIYIRQCYFDFYVTYIYSKPTLIVVVNGMRYIVERV